MEGLGCVCVCVGYDVFVCEVFGGGGGEGEERCCEDVKRFVESSGVVLCVGCGDPRGVWTPGEEQGLYMGWWKVGFALCGPCGEVCCLESWKVCACG